MAVWRGIVVVLFGICTRCAILRKLRILGLYEFSLALLIYSFNFFSITSFSLDSLHTLL